MNTRTFNRLVSSAVILLLTAAGAGPRCLAAPPATATAPARPNVVVILTDDQRWDCVGCADRPYLGIRTPHIDRLAAEGARFRNAFVTTSLCSPSRASMLSGLYAHSHKVVNNFTDFPADLPSYPRSLKAAGYETAYIGKFHMGEQDDAPRPGFDHWVSHTGQGRYHDNTFNVNGRHVRKEGYYTRVVTEFAVDWLRRPHARPFLLILGHKAPHGPFVPEERYRNLYDGATITYPASALDLAGKPTWVEQRLDTWHGIYGPLYEFRKTFPDRSPDGVKTFAEFVRSYLGTIASVDDSVGAVYEALRDTGRLDNTLLIFLSDNGFLLGEHGMIDKRTMHEESIRIPLIMRFPPLIRPSTVLDEMALNIDLAPTIVDICRTQPLPNAHGRSWKPLFQGDTTGWRTAWYYEYDYEKQFPYTPNVRGVRTTTWKYIRYPHGDDAPDRHRAELYDLEHDPHERRNRVDDPGAARVLAHLTAELQRLMKECGALPDSMPLDQGIQAALPEKSIR